MAKQGGLGWDTLTLDNAAGSPTDIRNDCTNMQYATPRAVWDVTGLDKSAFERELLLADFSATLNGVYNPTVSHLVLRTATSTTVKRTLVLGLGAESITNEVLVTDYSITRAQGGEMTWTAPIVLSDGTVPTWVTA